MSGSVDFVAEGLHGLRSDGYFRNCWYLFDNLARKSRDLPSRFERNISSCFTLTGAREYLKFKDAMHQSSRGDRSTKLFVRASA